MAKFVIVKVLKGLDSAVSVGLIGGYAVAVGPENRRRRLTPWGGSCMILGSITPAFVRAGTNIRLLQSIATFKFFFKSSFASDEFLLNNI
jgi:hypothetical protein